MKVSTGTGGDPPLPFCTVFFFFVHIESKLRKHKRKSIFTWHFPDIVQSKIAKDTGHLCFFLNEISREKVVRKPSRFPFRDWRVHRKYHIKVPHFGTLSMHSSISKWEAWWTFATFCAKQSCLFRAKKLVKKPPRFPFRDFFSASNGASFWHQLIYRFAMCRSFFS